MTWQGKIISLYFWAQFFSRFINCVFFRIALAEAIIYANTENSLSAALSLLDKDAFSGLLLPQITFLARLKNPSVELINKLNDYLSAKPESFSYLKKMYLIYSTLVSTYCKKNDCSVSDLVKYLEIIFFSTWSFIIYWKFWNFKRTNGLPYLKIIWEAIVLIQAKKI